MVSRNKSFIQFSISLIFLFTPVFLGAMNVNETINLKKDGSGILTFSYLEKEATVKGKNFMIGNLPFTKEKLADYFKAPNSYIQLSTVEKSQKDNTMTQVTVVISFTDISKLGDAKGLAHTNFSYTQTDSGAVLKNTINPDFVKTNMVDQIYYVLKSEGDIKSSNGKVTDKSAEFFRGKDYLNGTEINFVATVESDGKTTSNKTVAGEEKGKSCGLFGLELPFLMLGGLVFSFNRKRKKLKS